jgi:hypothetical protein
VADFVAFVFRLSPDMLAATFRARYEKLPTAPRRKKGQEENRRSLVYEWISTIDKDRLAETAMLQIAKVTDDIVLQWFAGFKGKKGSTPSKSVFGIAQSALVDLFKRHGETFPEKFYDYFGIVGRIKPWSPRSWSRGCAWTTLGLLQHVRGVFLVVRTGSPTDSKMRDIAHGEMSG